MHSPTAEHPAYHLPALSGSEARLLGILGQLSQGRCQIHCKAPLPEISDSRLAAGISRMQSQHVDFLVCRVEDGLVMVGVELWDPMERGTVQGLERDALLTQVFAGADIPLIRVHPADLDRPDRIALQLGQAWEYRRQRLEMPTPGDTGAKPHRSFRRLQ